MNGIMVRWVRVPGEGQHYGRWLPHDPVVGPAWSYISEARVRSVMGIGGRRGRARRRAGYRQLMAACDRGCCVAVMPDLRQGDERCLPSREPLGYRERRRRVKLLRRARDRGISEAVERIIGVIGVAPRHEIQWNPKADLPSDWWSTPEGRAAWTANDREAKRRIRLAHRECIAAMRTLATVEIADCPVLGLERWEVPQ